jgi:cell division topological specificity factor
MIPIFSKLFRKPSSSTAMTAKGRLQVIIAQERTESGGPDFLRLMHDELLDVVRKYVDVDPSAVSVQVDEEGNREVLEVNVVLPERTKGIKKQPTSDSKKAATKEPVKEPASKKAKPSGGRATGRSRSRRRK